MKAVLRTILVWAVFRSGIAMSESLPIQNGLDTPVGIAGFHERLVTDGLGVLFPGEEQAHVPGGIVTFGGGEDTWPQLFRMGLVPVEKDGTRSYPFTVELDDETGEALFRNANGALFYSIEPAYAAATDWFRMRLGVPAFGPIPAYRELSHLVSEWILVHEDGVESLQVQGRNVQSQKSKVQSRKVQGRRDQSREVEGVAFTEFEITDSEPPEYVFSVAWNGDAVSSNDVLDLYGAPSLTTDEWYWLASIAATNESPFELTLSETNFPWYIPPVTCPRPGCSCPACVPAVVTNYAGSAFDPSATNLTMTIVTNTACNCPSGASTGFFRLFRRADSDEDGLLDAEEVLFYGTDPLASDSDGDGLDDAEEIDLGTDPLSVDTDADGLSDGTEVLLELDPSDSSDGLSDGDEDGLSYVEERNLYCTDPFDWDTDSDGLSDGMEIQIGTDPLTWDSDHDQISDGMEWELGTNPLSWDSDEDGLTDDWEINHPGFDPLDPADAEADTDGDGVPNVREIMVFGTDWRFLDSDGDGLSDGYEITNTRTDPRLPDTDGDGLDDLEEVSLGTNPLSVDSDLDGSPDGWEVLHGFDPLEAEEPILFADVDGDRLYNRDEAYHGTDPNERDTDGDGICDSDETGWYEVGTGSPFDTTSGTNLLSGLSDLDDGVFSLHLPFPLRWHGTNCTEAVVGINGITVFHPDSVRGPTYLSSEVPDLYEFGAFSPGTVYVAGSWDDLAADRDDMTSEIRFSIIETNGLRHAVLDYAHLGFHPAYSNDFVSFQIVWTESTTDSVQIVYYEASGSGAAPGSTVGVQDDDCSILFSFGGVAPAVPGRKLVFHPGSGTDPLRADSDGDGLNDFEEIRLGTDPWTEDTDGDGLSDAFEQACGWKPLENNEMDSIVGNASMEDFDGDGLSNIEEMFQNLSPLLSDTDGDGIPDMEEISQGSNPLDPSDTEDRHGVSVQFTFGDHSESQSEKYRLRIVPESGDRRGPRTIANLAFGNPNTFQTSLLPGVWYEVSMDHIASNGGEPDYDYVLAAEITVEGFGDELLFLDPDGIFGTHTESTSFFARGKTAKLCVVRASLVHDADRNGIIDENDRTNTPLRVWINNDYDTGAVSEGSANIPRTGMGRYDMLYNNSADPFVNGLADLEDFFPLFLDLSDPLSRLATLSDTQKIQIRLRQADDALRIFETELSTNRAGCHLTAPPNGFANHAVKPVSKKGLFLDESFLENLSENPSEGIVLLEGKRTTRAPLIAEILLGERVACRVEKPLVVDQIAAFYHWINLRDVTGGDVDEPSSIGSPAAFPDDASNGKNVVFLHGFNVNESEARGWNAEMFKRLWQSGSNAKYYGVTWEGDTSWPNGLHYHESVVNAFRTAPALAAAVNDLSGDVTIMAHSLGTLLAASAVQDDNMRANRLMLFNSAIPSEAIDPTTINEIGFHNPMVHEDWAEYPARVWASCWYKSFPIILGDNRMYLKWENRFSRVPEKIDLFNYYSSGDEVLSLYTTELSSGAIKIEGDTGGDHRAHSWQKQERFKGCSLQEVNATFAGTTWMGWGFSSSGWSSDFGFRNDKYTVSLATAATDWQLRQDPVFRHNPFSLISDPAISFDEIDQLLAKGVPALSPPVGTVSILPESESTCNVNMNDLRFRSSWHAFGLQDRPFCHSDIVCLSYQSLQTILADIVLSANLK